MRLARVLGAIGRGLISAGVIVLLFVAYQLWGTGLQHQQAQSDLDREFQNSVGGVEVDGDAESLAAAAAASQASIGVGQLFTSDPDVTNNTDGADDSATSSTGPSAVGEPGASLIGGDFTETERQEILAKIYPEPGEAFARVVIPAINVDQISVEGVSVEDLRKGPGHYQTTPNPGQAGNAAIAGHRTTYGAPFHRVDELNPGDPIFVTTAQGTFEYRVKGFDDASGQERGYFIVSPSETWVLGQDLGGNLLTLTACHPKYSARERIIVQAELVGEPVPTIPREEALDLGALTIDSGSADERAAEADVVDGGEIPEEERVIIGDDVAADDDPTVDPDGNPIDLEAEAAGDQEGVAIDDDSADLGGSDDAGTEASAEDASTSEDSVPAGEGAAGLDEVEVSSEDSELTSTESPLGDTDDFGEGLNGDRTKIRPAIMWGIAGLAIWMTAWFMGQRMNRRWTLYAIGLVPFGFVLWSAFVNVDQALPSY